MTLLGEYFAAHGWALALAAALLGLVVGSILYVVLHCLPLMMEREWRAQCRELSGGDPQSRSDEPFNLAVPASRCPHCGHAIGARDNIPVLSYLWLKGRCRTCGAAISRRYPLIELATAAVSAAVAWHFGFTFEAGAALLLSWALIALSVIDIDHQLLPDAITLPFLWLGLLLSLAGLFATPAASILGAAAGYLVLWSVYVLFKWTTGKEGMGYGDFKLLAMLGAWLGWQALPVVIIFSSLVGAVVGVGLIVLRGRDRSIPIPFGPYLAAAGWLALLWGDELTGWYLRFSGMAV